MASVTRSLKSVTTVGITTSQYVLLLYCCVLNKKKISYEDEGSSQANCCVLCVVCALAISCQLATFQVATAQSNQQLALHFSILIARLLSEAKHK